MGINEHVKLHAKHQKKLGGTRAAMFVYAMVGLENMAFISTAISLVTYFYAYMNFSLTKSATTLTNYLGTAFLLSLFGGFISDTYLSRFTTGILFASFEVVGYALLAVQAHFQQLRPIPCNPAQVSPCQQVDSGQEAILFTGLYLIAFGTGGVKAALPSLGADQFDERDPKEAESLASFFNWFLFSVTTGAIFGVTFVVWISSNQGWDWALGVCSLAVFVAALFLLMGKSMFRNYVPKESAILRILQVFVVAIRNRKIPLPENTEELHDIRDKEIGMTSDIIQRTDQFRCLDRAAIVSNAVIASEFLPSGSWKLCTVSQVEETKILIRMLPIILSTIFMNTCLAQLQTFTIQQSTTMDRDLLGFKVPGPSIPVIPLVFMAILIPLYDRFFVPFVRMYTGIPTGIRHLQRIGVGLVLSAISMAVAGIVETRRKSVALDNNMVDSPGPLPMSVFWLGYQYAIFGVADMFTLVGLLEFFYEESSPSMKSLGTAISWCSMIVVIRASNQVVADQLLQVVSELGSRVRWLPRIDQEGFFVVQFLEGAEGCFCLGYQVINNKVLGVSGFLNIKEQQVLIDRKGFVDFRVYRRSTRMTGAKFDIEKFDGTGDFGLWRVKMRALLIQHGCEAALEVLPADMEAQAKAELNKKAHSAVILCLASYEHFVDILLYGREALTLEDVMATLNSKEIKERSKEKGDDGEGLYVRGRTDRRDSRQSRGKSRSKSRGRRLKCYICQSEDHLKRNDTKNNRKKSM
ncbi:NRT1/ PTR family 4.5-like protein [Tanacetum coccineum]|uniref:NRT1/ PTR family 4.5-like protein n=1 Tax=Tanacetum coccineum TaxID=301880 RepID=A0ABQ5AKH9_9ASTR